MFVTIADFKDLKNKYNELLVKYQILEDNNVMCYREINMQKKLFQQLNDEVGKIVDENKTLQLIVNSLMNAKLA